MASQEPSEAARRAEELATQASGLMSVGDSAGAYRILQEAVHLAPETQSVKEAFSNLQIGESEQPLLRLCKRFVFEHDESSGQEAIASLSGPEKVADDIGRNCLELLLAKGLESNPKVSDNLIHTLVRRTRGAKTLLAEKIQTPPSTTRSFEEIYSIGNGAADSIVVVILAPEAWKSEETRLKCERDIFRLYLAKLLQTGDDDDSRAMRGIAQLLATDVGHLQDLIDEDTFDELLSALDYRHPISTKTPAILAIAKFLEASGQRGQQMLTQYVTSHFAKQHTEDMILAFSAAGAVFPIATSTASTMLLTPGFLPSLVPLLERKTHSRQAKVAALEMLSAACADSTCRENIRSHCLEWILRVASEDDTQMSILAALVLSKVQGTPGQNEKSTSAQKNADSDALVRKLILLLFENPKANRDAAFEGLAHQSVRSNVKETLVDDKQFLEIFFQEVKLADRNSPAIFGGLSIIDNLTAYLPVLTEEQKRVAQLKAYANAAPQSSDRDVLNEGKAVGRRCEALVEAGLVPVIVEMQKHLPPSGMALVFKIFLSLSKTPRLRGKMVQQGAVRLLLSRWSHIEGNSAASTIARQNASQAIARLLISVDPTILFGYTGNALLHSSVTALVSLLNQSEGFVTDGPKDLLPTFEALLALTNLCSVPRNGAAPKVIKEARSNIEDLMLSNNINVRRAATELVTNLVQHPDGIAIYADGSPETSRRLHILLALAGSDDVGTRKAAGGALASLTDNIQILDAINKQSRGAELLLAIIKDDNEEVIYRGLVCIENVHANTADAGKVLMKKLHDLGINSVLQSAAKNVHSEDIQALLSSLMADLA